MKNLLLATMALFGIACNQIGENQKSETEKPQTQSEEQVNNEQPPQVEEKKAKEPSAFKGYFCTGEKDFDPLSYTREYKEDGNNFITIYKISSRDNGYYLNITATHYKSEQKIIVSIDDITVSKELGHISTQEISYNEPSLKMFGRANALKANGMDEQGRLPNDLALMFASNKFENIKVVHIVKGEGTEGLKWYVLDEDN